MAETVRIIKKYQNRKLYDTQDSCYVTLDGIAKMIRDGEEIVVIDNNSKTEVTALILTQVLYEQEKTHQSVLPVAILKNIIKSANNNLFEFMQKFILGSLDAHLRNQEELTIQVERLTQKGDLTAEEASILTQHIKTITDSHRNLLDQKIEERLEKFVASGSTNFSNAEFQNIANRALSTPTSA